MIYEFPDTSMRIRQGDIFIGLPRIDMSLNNVLIVSEVGERIAQWAEIAAKGDPVNIIVPVRPVAAIVATQDCDAARSRDITLCEIRSFRDREAKEIVDEYGLHTYVYRCEPIYSVERGKPRVRKL